MNGIMRAARNTILSIVVLAVLAVGGGVAYTYFLGPDGTQTPDAIQEAPEPSAAQQIKRPQLDPNAPVNASVAVLTSPAMQGDNALLSVRTSPQAKCTPVVMYNSVPVKDSGLAAKEADEFGTVGWSWTVAADAPVGSWPVKVTCVKGAKSAVVQADQKIEQKSSSN